jgi:transposase
VKIVALDVHRNFGQIAMHEQGRIRDAGRVAMERNAVLAFARTLNTDDEVVLEETGNTAVLVRLLSPFVRRVVVANPLQVRAIAHARVSKREVPGNSRRWTHDDLAVQVVSHPSNHA